MSILVVFSVVAIALIAYMAWKGKATMESFEDQRQCSVYYLSDINTQKDACDKGHFEEAIAALQHRKKQLLASPNPDRKEINDLTVAITTPRVGECKFSFDGWNENVSDPLKNGLDTTDIQSRNGTLDGTAPNPKSNQWAFCYRRSQDYDRTKFQTSDAASLYPQNVTGGTQVRMDFSYLDYKRVQEAYCKTGLPGLDPNFPTENTPAFLRLIYNGDTEKYTAVDLVVNDRKGALITYPSERQNEMEKAVYGKLFEVQLQGKDLMLIPKSVQMRLYKFRFDACGRVIVKPIDPIFINFASLVAEVYQSVDLAVMRNIDDNLLQYARNLGSLDARINERTQQKFQLSLDIETLVQKIQNTSMDLIFTQGILKRRIPITSEWNSTNHWYPNADVSNHDSFIAFKEKAKAQAIRDGTMTEQIMSQVGYGPEDNTAKTFHEYEGFIYLNAGSYRFKLNSDDAGEMLMASVPYRAGMKDSEMQPTTIMSTYYGMHGMGHQGTITNTLVVPQGQQGYYKTLIHWFEWQGHDGYRLYYSRNGTPLVPVTDSMFFTAKMNSTTIDENLKHSKEQEKASIETDIANLMRVRNALGASTRHKARQVVTALVNTPRFSALPIDKLSSDSAFYLWPGDLGVPVRANAVPITAPQYMTNNIMDINANIVEADPFVINLQTPPEYTVMMWLKVQNPNEHWRQIFFHGVADDWANNKVDRTPGVWIYPAQSDGKVRVHFRHTAKNCEYPSWRGDDKNCGLDMGSQNPSILPSHGQWFHFAATIQTDVQHNASVVTVYLNGRQYDQVRLKDNNKFDWNMLYGKKLWIGTWKWTPLQATGPIYAQKMKWYSIVKSGAEVLQEFQSGYVDGGPTPYPAPVNVPATLDRLFTDLTAATTYHFKIGNAVYNVYVEPASNTNGNQPWLLICNYNRNANDAQSRTIRKGSNYRDPFPQSLLQNADSWGQVPKEILQQIPFTSVRFLGTNKSKTIHFTTRHPDVINYIKTGRGKFPISQPKWFTLLSNHTASIPQYATHAFDDRGDWALHDAPFFIAGKNHWDMGFESKRWEVDDYTDHRNATTHSVWIGL